MVFDRKWIKDTTQLLHKLTGANVRRTWTFCEHRVKTKAYSLINKNFFCERSPNVRASQLMKERSSRYVFVTKIIRKNLPKTRTKKFCIQYYPIFQKFGWMQHVLFYWVLGYFELISTFFIDWVHERFRKHWFLWYKWSTGRSFSDLECFLYVTDDLAMVGYKFELGKKLIQSFQTKITKQDFDRRRICGEICLSRQRFMHWWERAGRCERMARFKQAISHNERYNSKF
jgi:hypothetical protein